MPLTKDENEMNQVLAKHVAWFDDMMSLVKELGSIRSGSVSGKVRYLGIWDLQYSVARLHHAGR